jgi:hypothetical protein
VTELIDRKAKGKEIELPESHHPDLAPELLMAALEASVKGRG